MLIRYQGQWSKENIEGLLYRRLANSYSKRARRELWLEIDKEAFYLLMSSPRSAVQSCRYKEKWKMSFREEGIRLRKCLGVDSLVMLAGVLALLFTAFCMLVIALERGCWGGFAFCAVLAVLGVWCIIWLPGKVIKGYFFEMMGED